MTIAENFIAQPIELNRIEGKREGNTMAEEGEEVLEEIRGEPTEDGLIVEYQVLNEAIWRRGRDTLLMISIFIPTALGLVLFAVQHRSELGRNIFINLPNAGFVPLASLILILISYFWCWTSTMLDNIFFDRIHEIEDLLHIEGHHYVLERIKCNTWFKFRRKMWHFILPLFIIAYLVAAIWLFRETVIG